MKKNSDYIIAIDAGGTFFKSAIVDAEGNIVPYTLSKTAIDLNSDAEAVLKGYEEIIIKCSKYINELGGSLGGVGVSTPGPFDYEHATSLMTHKFKSIYGVNLEQALKKRGSIPGETPVKFLHDVHAFILGEHWKGAASGYSRAIAVTIGTGIGFGCIFDNRIKDNGSGGPYVSLFRRPCEGGILEDHVSRRGIIANYCRLSGIEENCGIDAKEIGALAESGRDHNAVLVYRRVGRLIAENIYDVSAELEIQCIVLGGQISRSFPVMEPDLKEVLGGLPHLKKICMGGNIDYSPLIGAAKAVLE